MMVSVSGALSASRSNRCTPLCPRHSCSTQLPPMPRLSTPIPRGANRCASTSVQRLLASSVAPRPSVMESPKATMFLCGVSASTSTAERKYQCAKRSASPIVSSFACDPGCRKLVARAPPCVVAQSGAWSISIVTVRLESVCMGSGIASLADSVPAGKVTFVAPWKRTVMLLPFSIVPGIPAVARATVTERSASSC